MCKKILFWAHSFCFETNKLCMIIPIIARTWLSVIGNMLNAFVVGQLIRILAIDIFC